MAVTWTASANEGAAVSPPLVIDVGSKTAATSGDRATVVARTPGVLDLKRR